MNIVTFRKELIGVGAAFLIGLLAGCAGLHSVETSTLSPTMEDDGSQEEYRLKPGDEIAVQVYREPAVSGTFSLDASGRIRHPLCGVLSAGGVTVSDLEGKLTELLGEKYLVNPRVIVSIVSARSSQVVMLGEVAKTGSVSIPFGGSMTLLQAIAEAGGFSNLASRDRVTVTRTVNGEEQSIRVRVSRLIAGQEPDFELQPDDVIMVPQIRF